MELRFCKACGKRLTAGQLYKEQDGRIVQYCSLECGSKRPREHKYNHEFLNYNNELSAYFLGWFVTDGHFSKDDKGISISSADKQIIDDICTRTQYEKSIYVRKMPNENQRDQYAISFHGDVSKRIYAIGYRPGPKGGKEFIPEFCKISDLFPHFLRGVIDGDGSIRLLQSGNMPNSIQVSIVSMCQSFLEEILVILRTSEIVRGGTVAQARPNLYKIAFGHFDSLQICEYIYRDATIKLERKYQNFLAGRDYDLKCVIQKNTTCSHPNCFEPAMAKGLCSKHYDAQYAKEYYALNKEECDARTKQWNLENRDQILAKRRSLYAENPEYYKQISQEWREKHPEQVKESKRLYRQEHKPEINEYKKQYRRENPELHRAMDHRKYEKHKEKISEYCKKKYQVNKEKIKERTTKYREEHKKEMAEYSKRRYQEKKDEIKKRRMERYNADKKARENIDNVSNVETPSELNK